VEVVQIVAVYTYLYRMSVTAKFFTVSVLMLAAIEALFFAGKLPPVPGIGLIFVMGSSLAGFIAYRIYKARKSSAQYGQEGAVLNQLQWYFAILSFFWIVDIFPHVFLIVAGVDVGILTITHWTAHIFLFLTVILSARIATTFFNPKMLVPATVFTTVLMLIALGFSIVLPDHLAYIPGSDYPLISANPLFSHVYTFASIVTAGFFGLYLIFKGLASPASMRMRAILLGLGFIFQVLIGMVIAYLHTWYTPALIYLFIWGWVVFPGISALMSTRRL